MKYLLTEKLRAYRFVADSTNYKRIASFLCVSFALFLFFIVIAPWQQNVTGSGQVVSWSPDLRQQTIDSPISGRLVSLLVQEGDQVSEGAVIANLSNNDPAYLERLLLQETFIEQQVQNSQTRVSQFERRLASLQQESISATSGLTARVTSLRHRVRAQRQTVARFRSELETALLQQTRQTRLEGEGLSSTRELELATLAVARARTSKEAADSNLRSLLSDISVLEAELGRVRASYASQIHNAEASLQSARNDVLSSQARLTAIQSNIATQRNQTLIAPSDGTIVRIYVRGSGQQVSRGTPLLVFAPAGGQRAVELVVDGFNAPLISPGRKVRLQFEGWPAIQFSGWPSVAVGTFGGQVAVVDALDNGQGNFRVLVVSDPDEPAWPNERYLRQGVRTNGWVLLDDVSVGFELWRQLNDFPPTVSREEE